MQNFNFIDPDSERGVVSKREILAKVKESSSVDSADIEWLDSITNEIDLTPDEADKVYTLLTGDGNPAKYRGFYKPALLFDGHFFYDGQDRLGPLKRFFRIELFNDERIKCIPLLFERIGGKEVFHKSVIDIIFAISAHCAQNKEFAEAYEAKLAEVRNNNGSLHERMSLYIDMPTSFGHHPKNWFYGMSNQVTLIRELEKPVFKMFNECFNLRFNSLGEFFVLLFVFLLQTPDGMQIPRWDEENYLCRLLLDFALRYCFPILDRMFSDYTTADVFLIVCNHLKWNNDNIPRFSAKRSEEDRWEHIKEDAKEYSKFLEAQLPELFNGVIPRKYLDSLCLDRCLIDNDIFPSRLLGPYLDEKIASAIVENNHEQIRDISRLLDNENWARVEEIGEDRKDDVGEAIAKNDHELLRDIARSRCHYGISFHEKCPCLTPCLAYKKALWRDDRNVEEKKHWLEQLQSRISSAMKILENGDHTEKVRDILRASVSDGSFLETLLISLMKSGKDKDPSFSLEDCALKYFPLEIFPKILDKSFLHESLYGEKSGIYQFNEDAYQNMMQQHPNLSREDALLHRLAPCFAAIAINNVDKKLPAFDSTMPDAVRWNFPIDLVLHSPPDLYFPEPGRQSFLLLCILDQLCERHEKGHDSTALIFEIVFRNKYYTSSLYDIVKKHPQVYELVVEHCYTVLKGSWDAPICTPITQVQIQAHIPARILGMHKGLWHGLKLLLMALRKSRKEWVDESLYVFYAPDSDGSLNLLGSTPNLPGEIELYFKFFHKLLKSLRQDFANGLSDWLKPLPESKKGNLEKRLAEFPKIEQDREGFDITYTEPDPVWRYAYVRAIADLGVDVDGKGHYIHSVMDKAAKEDPSEMVRTAAEKASKKLKNLRDGWNGDKHYQKINLAFWWLKQASRLALNLPIDEKKSLETRSREENRSDYISEEERRRTREESKRQTDEWNEKEEMESKQRAEEEKALRQAEIKKMMRASLGI